MMMEHEEKVIRWFNAVDWIQAGSRIAAILVVSFILVFLARRLISGLEKFTATHAHDTEAQKRAATVSNVLRKLATILITIIALLAIPMAACVACVLLLPMALVDATSPSRSARKGMFR